MSIAFGKKIIFVTFAWSDNPPIPISIDNTQTVRQAVTPHLPFGISGTQFSAMNIAGEDVTNWTGSRLNNNDRIIVQPGVVTPGGI